MNGQGGAASKEILLPTKILENSTVGRHVCNSSSAVVV